MTLWVALALLFSTARAAVVEVPSAGSELANPLPVEPEALASLDAQLAIERGSGESLERWRASLAEAAPASTKEAERLLLSREAGVRVRRELAKKDTKTITEYDGVPRRIQALETAGRVFRHWIKSDAALAEILRTGLLRPGPVSYVEFTGSSRAYIKDIYPDLRGVFFTTPDRSAAEPRIMNEEVRHYVDFRLPEGVAALDLDMGQVLLVPGADAVPVEIESTSLRSVRSDPPTAALPSAP